MLGVSIFSGPLASRLQRRGPASPVVREDEMRLRAREVQAHARARVRVRVRGPSRREGAKGKDPALALESGWPRCGGRGVCERGQLEGCGGRGGGAGVGGEAELGEDVADEEGEKVVVEGAVCCAQADEHARDEDGGEPVWWVVGGDERREWSLSARYGEA